MKETKLKQLFEAARREPAPLPPDHFADVVQRAVSRQGAPEPFSILDQLAFLFPRVAVAAVILICCCLAGDFLLSMFNGPDLGEGLARLSDQWLLAGNGI
ncbi:MAG TPA: hypothetical protein VK327_13040 [Candidatus Paceibacterota bacterium]|nr:hypothetical protein [Candidatus Paceibacterota bacterium]